MTSSYSNAYHSCSMMVRFKWQRCTIYESAVDIKLVTIHIHANYEYKASRALKFWPCGPMKFFQNRIARRRPTRLLFIRGWDLHSTLTCLTTSRVWRGSFSRSLQRTLRCSRFSLERISSVQSFRRHLSKF